jgi:AraC-like DNA-binding protein
MPPALGALAPRTPSLLPGRARFERELAALMRASGVLPSGRRGFWVRLEWEGRVSGEIRRVQTFVEVHVGEVRALDELAEVAGLSRFHFARRFREEVGEPPWAFVRRVRAERAAELLREGRTPAEAAHEAGFADQAHLTRALRERFGRTPGQIRREAAEASGDPEENRKDVQDSEAPPA